MTVVEKITDGDVVKAGTTGLCAGANLRTPCGERRVEFLRAGDLVVTRDNGLQPVTLIWTRMIPAAELAADPSLAPVLLPKRAIAPMMPAKPLMVGGAHREKTGEGRFMFRVGKDNHEEALARPGAMPMDFTGRVMRGFVFIDADDCADAMLQDWISFALSFAASLPPKPGN